MMFRSARLKLAGWYVLIIMIISMSFSIFIYGIAAGEIHRAFQYAERRFIERDLGFNMRPIPPHIRRQFQATPDKLFFLQDELVDANDAVKVRLGLINIFILVASSLAGYFFAGKTLKPIEETMAAQKRFVSDASHELRTPLTALKTSLEVNLRDKELSKQAKGVLKENLETVGSLELLANRLLRMRPLEDGKEELHIEEVSFKEACEHALKQIEVLIKKKGINLNVSIVDDLKLEADKASLSELLLIFLDNSLKYTPKGGEISVNAISTTKNPLITIKDNGAGIKKKPLPQIFDRFFRADSARAKKESVGFGLGLSLAKSIVDSHHGSIDVDSEVGKGTTFTIKLPLKHS